MILAQAYARLVIVGDHLLDLQAIWLSQRDDNSGQFDDPPRPEPRPTGAVLRLDGDYKSMATLILSVR